MMRLSGKYRLFTGDNLKALIWFELLYKSAMMAIGIPLFKWLVNGLIWVTGFKYLTAENIRRFATHPLTILFALVIIVIMVFYGLIEIFAIIYITDQSAQGKHTHSGCAFSFARKQAARLRHPRNFALLFVIMLMIPALNLGVLSAIINVTAIPQVLLGKINGSFRNSIIFYGMIILILFLFSRFLYTLHYFAVENYAFQTAGERSRRLSRHHHLRDLIMLTAVQIGMLIAFAVICGGGILVIVFAGRHLAPTGFFGAAVSSVLAIFIGVASTGFAAMSFPLCYTLICRMYYEKKAQIGEPVRRAYDDEPLPDHRHRRFLNRLTAVVLTVAVIISSLYLYGTSRGKYSLQIERIRTMSVSAHRGASAYYPENTMAAFVGAFEQGADWIELDVHLSQDKQVFVMHDNSFRRTAGLNKKAWELTWGEICHLDAGKFFSAEFAGEPFVLLQDAIDYAKHVGIRLNIELKPSAEEEGLTERVADIVRESGFEADCVITSQSYDALEKIKAYAPELTTVYVMGFAAGRIEKLAAADNFSIEESFITRRLVNRLHNNGKEVYAWTVNSRKNIDRMIDLGVDNIITDNVPLAKQCVNESRAGNLLLDYVYAVMDLIQ